MADSGASTPLPLGRK